MLEFETLDQVFMRLMRKRDYEGAIALLGEVFAKAREARDFETALESGSLLVSALVVAQKDEEALEIYRTMLVDSPADTFLRLRMATFLVTMLKHPSEALEVLEPIAEYLLSADETRHATLGVLGLSHALLGRLDEAKTCFDQMLDPNLARMDPSAFDLLLVEFLVSSGEMKDECKEYLSIAFRQAQEAGDREVAARAESLLRQL